MQKMRVLMGYLRSEDPEENDFEVKEFEENSFCYFYRSHHQEVKRSM